MFSLGNPNYSKNPRPLRWKFFFLKCRKLTKIILAFLYIFRKYQKQLPTCNYVTIEGPRREANIKQINSYRHLTIMYVVLCCYHVKRRREEKTTQWVMWAEMMNGQYDILHYMP